ncbi:hypothetical protein [Methylocystis echinoides]|nr:hypothetical protein [Methylocystis echinoides]
MGELIAVAEIKDMLGRLETNVDLLLSWRSQFLASSKQAGSDNHPLNTEDDDTDWMDGLDRMTLFNLEKGWTTKEEVKKGLRDG